MILILLGFGNVSSAKVIEYKLNVNEKKVNISGKEVVALSLNNSIPGPTIKAKLGDVLRIEVTNSLDVETSIHWHGVLVPNNMDGVPYVNTPPIKPGKIFTYEFPIKHTGTYWYHAHSAFQEQQGVYGSLVFYPEHEVKDYDEEHVLVLSDWTDENPNQVLANIKQDADYYALKKDSVQSWLKVLENSTKAIKIRINNAWTRMGPMDMSDIGYDAFLINGKKSSILSHARSGARIKLRIINAAASSYFIFEYSGGPMKIIEADGVKIEPFTAKRVRISMAETYDVIVTVPESKTYEFRASAEDGTGYAITHIGHGKLVAAPMYPKPNLVLMNMMGGMAHGVMGGHEMSNMLMGPNFDNASKHGGMQMNHSVHQGMRMGALPKNKELPHVDFLNNYKTIKSPTITTLPKGNPTRTVTLRLTGSMERYVWTINNTPMYAADKIVIKKGENVKFILANETMMNHPIHLHGHFFRVLNGQGEYSPLKHTVNVSPFETVEIEFEANEEKDWIFHCHNLYHMKLGMGGTIHYDGTEHDQALMDHNGDHSSEHGNVWFNATELEGYSNFVNAITKFTRNNDNIIINARRYTYKSDYETEAIYQRYVSQFLGFYVGGKFKREDREIANRGIFGATYILPLLIKADLRVNTKGKLRFGLSNEHQLADMVSLDWMWNSEKEYTLGLSYAITKWLYVLGNYDSKEKFGIGIGLRFGMTGL